MRKFWILAAAAALANAARYKTLAAPKSYSGDDAPACYFAAEFCAKRLKSHKDGESLCDLQRRLCRGERGGLLRGVGVFLKGYVA